MVDETLTNDVTGFPLMVSTKDVHLTSFTVLYDCSQWSLEWNRTFLLSCSDARNKGSVYSKPVRPLSGKLVAPYSNLGDRHCKHAKKQESHLQRAASDGSGRG